MSIKLISVLGLMTCVMGVSAWAIDKPRTVRSMSAVKYEIPSAKFRSLKAASVEARTAPSDDAKIIWNYQRAGLPLLIIAERGDWNQVRDIHGDESWIQKSDLSTIRTVMSFETTDLHAQPNQNSRRIAIAERNNVLTLSTCKRSGWCQVKSKSGLKGWALQRSLWGSASSQ